MKTNQNVIICGLLAAVLLTGVLSAIAADSQCVDCHTSPRKLIQITREIAKMRPQVESLSKGPG